MLKFDINFYPIKANRIISIIKVFKGDKLVDINDNGTIYSISGRKVKQLSGTEITSIVEDLSSKYLENKIVKSLDNIDREQRKVRNIFSARPIINKFEKNSIPLHSIIAAPSLVPVKKLTPKEIQSLKDYFKRNLNGKSKGNIFYYEDQLIPCRLGDAYLRYSTPVYYLKGITNYTKNQDRIYVTAGGGVFYSKKKLIHFNQYEHPIIELISKNTNYSNLFLSCFLKSSFFIWYILQKFDKSDIFYPEVFKELIIPKFNFNNQNVKNLIMNVENTVNSILDLENKHLKLNLTAEKIIDFAIQHNNKIEELAYNIDTDIYNLLSLTREEIDVVEFGLVAHDVFMPSKTK